MNNKTDIEEDIKKLEKVTKLAKETGLDRTLAQAIENILADRERLEKDNTELTIENFRLNTELENKRKEYQETYKDVREELKELQTKANKYDSLVEKIKKDIEEYPDATYTKYYLLDFLGILKGE